MTFAGTVEGRDRLRLFCALTLPPAVLDALERWQGRALRCDARLVPRGHLHVTLAFLGGRRVDEVEAIAAGLRAAAAGAGPIALAPRRYRETGSVGMLVLDDDGGRAGGVAEELQLRLERLGVYERERRAWLPHVTVLRFRRPPRLEPELPALDAFSPSGAALYHSVLRSGGAQYEVLTTVALGG